MIGYFSRRYKRSSVYGIKWYLMVMSAILKSMRVLVGDRNTDENDEPVWPLAAFAHKVGRNCLPALRHSFRRKPAMTYDRPYQGMQQASEQAMETQQAFVRQLFGQTASSHVSSQLGALHQTVMFKTRVQSGELRPQSSCGASCFHDMLCIHRDRGERREHSLNRR